MRLLTISSTGQLSLTKDFVRDVPCYAILSHTWGPDEDEVSFNNINDGSAKSKAGYAKLLFCGQQARKDGLQHYWVDTCCIDKANYTELSEAITSMFRWYRDATKCYVYMSDVSRITWKSEFRKSRWFTRSWTLQELLAPSSVEFFSRECHCLGNKRTLEEMIHEITGIPCTALRGTPLAQFSVDERLQWAARRNATRSEDKAYCLLGIFEIFLPLMYGEGTNAFDRLRAEIDKRSREKDDTDERSLAKLANVSDASFRSYQNQRHRPCLKDTRVEILGSIMQWAQGTSPQCIFWLQGMAGIGKSTVAFSIASMLQQASVCLATFFFRRGFADLAHARKLISSIVHQFSRACPTYRRLVLDAVGADPDLGHSANLPDQYEKLIVEPLRTLQSSPTRQGPFVLIIDALDECDDKTDLRIVLRLLARTKDIPSLHFRILVTSRPEWVVQQGFENMPGLIYHELVLHDVPRRVVDHDIETFFRHELGLIQRERRLSIDWPGESRISRLTAKAGGLFIFAATACRYIAESPWTDPQERLAQVCDSDESNSLMTEDLDQMYTIVVQSCTKGRYTQDEQERIASRFRRVVGTIAIVLSPLSVADLHILLCDHPQPDRAELEETLRPLRAVINVPTDASRSVELLHLSFRDFLLSPERCLDPRFRIDEHRTHQDLARNCLCLLSSSLHKDMCNLSSPTMLISEISRDDIDRLITPAVQYGCRYWPTHVITGRSELVDGGEIHQFFRTQYLCWLEVMSLIGQIPQVLSALRDLMTLTDAQTSPALYDLLHDCQRFILTFREIISRSPGQLYQSCLFFSPQKSIVRQNFRDIIPTDVVLSTPTRERWTADLQTLETPSSRVESLAFSPNGQLLASVSKELIRLWDVQTGDCYAVLADHSDTVLDVAFSPDGSVLGSASRDGTVRLWDTQTYECYVLVDVQNSRMGSVVFSPNGQFVASVSQVKTGNRASTIHLWDIHARVCRGTIQRHHWCPHASDAAGFSPNSQLLAVLASDDRTIGLWNVQKGAYRSHLYHRPDDGMFAFQRKMFSSDGQSIISAAEGSVRVWEIQTGDYHDISISKSTELSLGVVCSPNGRLVAFLTYDHIQMLDVQTERYYAIPSRQSRPIRMWGFSHDSCLVASSSVDGTISVSDVQTGECRNVFKGHDGPVSHVAFSPDGRIMASATDDTLRLWSLSADANHALEHSPDSTRSMVISPCGRLVASRAMDGSVQLRDLHTGSNCDILEDYEQDGKLLAFSPDGQVLASSSADGVVRLRHVRSGELHATFRSSFGAVKTAVFPLEGWLVAMTFNNGSVTLWDTSTGVSRDLINSSLNSDERSDWDEGSNIIFSPDGQLLALAQGHGNIHIWDVLNGHCRAVLNGSSDRINAIAISPDGSLIASASTDNTIQLWYLQTEVHHSDLEDYGIVSLAFSPDSHLLAAGDKDGNITLWNIRIGGDVTLLYKGLRGSIKSMVFSADGRYITSGTDVGTVVRWDVQNGYDVLSGYSTYVSDVALSPSGQLAVSRSLTPLAPDTIRLWDVQKGLCTNVIVSGLGRVEIIVFSPCGQLIALGSGSAIELWEVQTMKLHNVLKSRFRFVAWVGLKFSDDGLLVAAAEHGGDVELWDVRTGHTQATFRDYSNNYSSRVVTFSSDNRLLASSGTADGLVQIWDLPTRSHRAMLEGHTNYVRHVAFSSDCQLVATSSDDSTVRIWDVGKAEQRLMLQSHPQPLAFGLNVDVLFVGGVAFDVSSGKKSKTENEETLGAPASACRIFIKDEWATRLGRRLLWLPPEYRNLPYDSDERTIAFGTRTGSVVFLHFSEA